MAKTLAVVGGGPKSMAIVAKACALKTMGRKVPDIKVIEPHVIGAHWGGHHGYTDGRHELGTGPEKDVGFPYNSAVWPGGQVDDLMMKMFSFPAFRLEKWNAGGPGAYSERIDRGGRIRTYHQEWAEYLQWVWGKAIFQAKASVELIPGTVSALTEIEDPKRWRIAYQSAKGPKHVDADGVVLTGPGPARHLPKQPIHPLISDAVDLWLNLDQFENLNADDEPIGIIGSGESAASAVQALARVLKEPVPIMVINRQGAIFSRGEGFFENQLYTEPEDWSSLPLVERRDIIRRTDRGVFSLQAMTELNQLQNLQHRRLIVKSLEIRQPENQPVLFGEYEIPLQRAIVAVGFDPWWFVGLVQDKTLKALLSNEAIRDQLLVGIGRDLTFPTDLVPFAKLHVPMLAGLAQGPGFPNLSCLGHVADRVLAEYVT